MVPTSADGGVEMPSYNIRHSIATKVAAKKTVKGYTLSEESCSQCEMPLMTLNGKSECKVCPAIKKWVQRKNETSSGAETTVDDEREDVVEEYAVDVDEEMFRDEAPMDPPTASYEEEWGANEEESNLEPDWSKDSESLAERFNVMKVARSASMESSACQSTQDLGKYGSSTSDDSEDSEAIRARVRAIICQARGQGNWDIATSSSEEESIKSPVLSWDDDKTSFTNGSMNETAAIKERAGEIINQARASLQAELSPHAHLCESASLDEIMNPDLEMWRAAIAIQSVARMFLAKKLYLGMLFRESHEYQQDEDALEETFAQATSDHFEPLGVNNPTVEDYEEGDWATGGPGDAPAREHTNEEWLVEDVTEEHVEDWAEDAEEQTNGEWADEEVQGPDGEYSPQESVQEYAEEAHAPKTTQETESRNVVVVQKNSRQPAAQPKQARAVPSRGLFAELACKFDDAVTDAIGKVHSIVTCSTSAIGDGAFREAYDAEQFVGATNPAEEGIIAVSSDLGHGPGVYEQKIVALAMRGWRVANKGCPRCKKSLMIRPEDGQMMCAGCDDIEAEPVQTFAPPEQAAYHSPPRPERTAGLPPPPPSPPAESEAGDSVSNLLYDLEMNRRLQLGWVAINKGCPYCSAQLMREPNESMDHCLACGPIFENKSAVAEAMAQVRRYPTVSSNTVDVVAPDAEDDAKENDAKVSQQLVDARLRIEDAKQFILARSNRRMPPSAHTTSQPLANSGVLRPQTNTSTGSDAFRSMESLMTPETDASPHQTARMTPGTAATIRETGSGYRTPQMPGKFFFA